MEILPKPDCLSNLQRAIGEIATKMGIYNQKYKGHLRENPEESLAESH